MGRGRRKRDKRVEIDLYVRDIKTAFEAALKLWDVWESPEGPAFVADITLCSALDSDGEPDPEYPGGWWITYRVLKHWGKEAWNR